MSFPSRFFGELQRRSVVKVAVGYAVSGWLLVQVASIVIPAFGWPEWVMRATLIALIAGFPAACVLAWAYEWTTAGIQPETDGDAHEPLAAASADTPAGEGVSSSTSVFQRLASWEVATVAIVMAIALGTGLFTLSSTHAEGPRHIAVLPFRVLSATEPDADVLAAGLMETLTSAVTQFGRFEEALWVVPAAEIPAAMTPSSARQQFGVSFVVSGSMQFAGQSVRLTLNLIDARTGRQVESRQVDVRSGRLLDLQDEATRHLARMLDVRIPRQTSEQRRGRPLDPEAGRLYVEGRGRLRNAATVDDVDAAIERFVRAVAIDSTFALAAAGLGEAYWQKYQRTQDVKWVNAAIWQSRRALSIDSTLAPAWTTLGILRSDQQHDEAAIEAFQRAIGIDPGLSDPYRHLATVYRRQGNLVRAETTYREAIARQPEYWKNYNLLGAFYYSRGRYDDAIAQYTRGLRHAPANPTLLNNVAVAHWQMQELDRAVVAFERLVELDSTDASAVPNLATAYFYLGRYDDAAYLYDRALTQYPKDYGLAGALADAQTWSDRFAGDAPNTYRRAIDLAREQLSVREEDPWVLASLAQYYARLTRLDSARVWLQRLRKATGDRESTDVVMSFSIGSLYESMGERDEAWAWMKPALDRNYGQIQLAYSPFLADLRQDPRAAAILASNPASATASSVQQE
ncbi:tetratricopeptide repeat protein [Longibacter sp.]|uniref:tetratricopeptide repeat protein n=1 Tax=Longibacter sp. TaxID=2045415 RepID=UPI003EBD7235